MNKKNKNDANLSATAEKNVKSDKNKNDDLKKTAGDGGFCVYIGPSVNGYVQSGTIYQGSKESVVKALDSAIKKYPLIEKLIVTDKTLAEDRVKVKTPGNALNVYYKKMLSRNK